MNRSEPTPPRIPRALLRWTLPETDADEIVHDLDAEFRSRGEAGGRLGAVSWYWSQALRSVLPGFEARWRRGLTGFEPAGDRLRGRPARLETLIRDTRFTLQRLARRPLYAGLVVTTLGLGVGGTAAIFGIVRPLLLEPLPYPAAEQLAVFWGDYDWSETEFSYLREEAVYRDFEAVAMFTAADVTLRQGDAPARLVHGFSASAEFFDVLGVGPDLGRGFRPEDETEGAEPVVVVSHGFWRSELGGDPSAIGEQLRIDGVDRTVVGVMPAGFFFPDPATRIWVPNVVDPEDGSGNHTLVGRIAPGAGLDDMTAEIQRITMALSDRFDYPPQWDKTRAPHLRPMREYLMGDVRPTLLAVLGGMGVLLLMACANAAALMVVQVRGRDGELAVRSAMGAARRRLGQQVAVEALVLAVLAGALGAGLAASGFRVLVAALPLGAIASSLTVDWAVFGGALAAAVVAGGTVALLPVAALFRGSLRSPLISGSSRVLARGGRLENGLVVAEVALAVVLVAGAALLVRTVGELRAIDPGFDAQDLVVVDIAAGSGDFSTEQRRALIGRVLDEVRSLPGITAAGMTHKLPLRGSGSSTGLEVEGHPMPEVRTTYFRVVSRGYFETMGIPIVAGREFDRTDRSDTRLVVIPNEALVREYIPDPDPLSVGVSTDFHAGFADVVGVAAGVAVADLTDGSRPTRYMLVDQMPWVAEYQTVVVRSSGDAAATLSAVRAAIHRVDPRIAIAGTTTMDRVVELALGPARQMMTLLNLLAGLALALGAVGVYGVVSHLVGRQTRAWGIRLALGLGPRRVALRIIRSGTAPVLMGVVIGLGASVALSRVLGNFLFQVRTTDPVALGTAAGALLLVGAAAAYLPARRAAALDPAAVLRDE